ncbi:RTA1 domain-containing protein, partial [Setomelanomma holmii]
LYPYKPSRIAGMISVIVFAILFLVHIFRLFKTRTWFCIPFIVGAAFEILGYAARTKGHGNPTAMNPFIIQTILILLAPILFAASVYMFLGRIVRNTGQDRLSIVRPTLLTKMFVGGDILCFLIQGVGAGILSKAKEKKDFDLGKAIILGGLVLQLVIFGLFMVVAVVFHVRADRVITKGTSREAFSWRKYLAMLYAVSIIITLRNVMRFAEYVGGEKGYLLQNEWPIYSFDAVPMAVVLVICVAWYVG